MTNAPWLIHPDVACTLRPWASVKILNDLEAVGYAAPWLEAEDTCIMNTGPDLAEKLPIATINVGTGFGAAVTAPTASSWHALPTEAGHMTMALAQDEVRLLGMSLVTVEAILSGPALGRFQRTFDSSVNLKRIWSRILRRVSGDFVLATGA